MVALLFVPSFFLGRWRPLAVSPSLPRFAVAGYHCSSVRLCYAACSTLTFFYLALVLLLVGLQGYDPDKDVAVLKIDAPQETLRPIAVGSSNTLKVNTW